MKKKYDRPNLIVFTLAAPVLGVYNVSGYKSGGTRDVGGDE